MRKHGVKYRAGKSKRSAIKQSHVKKFGNILEVGLCRQMHGCEAARHCRCDAATVPGKEDDHFVDAAQYSDANGGSAVGERAAGVSLRFFQQILHGAHVSLPHSQLKPSPRCEANERRTAQGPKRTHSLNLDVSTASVEVCPDALMPPLVWIDVARLDRSSKAMRSPRDGIDEVITTKARKRDVFGL
jgi:hypothetical protein